MTSFFSTTHCHTTNTTSMAAYILMAHLDTSGLDVEGCGSYRVYEACWWTWKWMDTACDDFSGDDGIGYGVYLAVERGLV